MPGVPYTLDSLISKQSEISADFQKMNRVFTIYGMPYLTLFQNILSLFSGFEFLKVSKSTKKKNKRTCLLIRESKVPTS